MQTKKRAKSVKFGKKISEEAKKQEIKSEVVPQAENKEEVVVKKDEEIDVKKEILTQQEADNAQEIKQQIAANISAKTEESDNSQPQDVNLTSEPTEESNINEPEKPQENPIQEQSKSVFGSFSQNAEQQPKKNNLLFFIIIVLLTFILGLVAIGGFYYFSNQKSEKQMAAVPTAVPTSEPTPTEEVVDLSAFSIEILNGSGTSGVAAKLKIQLTDAEFTVNATGNADKSDYIKAVISAKKNVSKQFITKLSEELEKTYIVEEKIEVLSDSEKSDVIVTIGSSTVK